MYSWRNNWAQMELSLAFSTWTGRLIPRTRQLVDLARPLKTTFHRAFDMSADLRRSLEDVVGGGADRILTSGAAQSALEGAATLRELVRASAGRIIIMAAGGIDDRNVEDVVKQTGVREVHVGLRTPVASPMGVRKRKYFNGNHQGSGVPAVGGDGRECETVDTSGRARG